MKLAVLMQATLRLTPVWLGAWSAGACSAGDKDDSGSCYLRELVCASCESTTYTNYCGKRSECASYCAVMKNRATTVYCEWHDDGVCVQDIPPTPQAPLQVCALDQTTKCGESNGTTRTFCDSDCSIRPGSNEYDAELGCLTEYGTKQGHGSSCDEAVADLSSSSPTMNGSGSSMPEPQPLPSAGPCTAQASDTACLTCAKRSCCDELEACAASDECVAIYACLAPCKDSACQQACVTAHPAGVSGINAYLTCGSSSCGAECSD